MIKGDIMETIKLSERDSFIFIETLMNPPEPNDKLKEAAKDYLTRSETWLSEQLIVQLTGNNIPSQLGEPPKG